MRSTLQSLHKIKINQCTLKRNPLSTNTHSNIKKEEYSTHRVCNYDPRNTDVNANANNPKIVTKSSKVTRHMEITRQECDKDPECKTKVCPTICGNVKKEDSVGHLTGGNVNNAQGHTENLGNTDINGNTKPQNIYVYDTPHQTSPNQTEIPDGTKYVKQPQVENIINKVENKK